MPNDTGKIQNKGVTNTKGKIESGRVSFVNCFGLEVTSHQTKIQWGGLGGSIWAKKIMFSLELGGRFSVDLG